MQVEAQSQQSEATLIPRDQSETSRCFSLERTVSPPPRSHSYLEREEQEKAIEEWRERASQLEIENENLKRWKLDHELELDRSRMQPNLAQKMEAVTTVEQPRREKKRKKGDNKPNKMPIEVVLPEECPRVHVTTTAPLPNQGHGDSDLSRSKFKLLKQLEFLRRNRFFAETSGDKATLQYGFHVETSIWNSAMTLSTTVIVKEVTQLMLSPRINLWEAQAIYEYNMHAVQEHLAVPLLTFRQFFKILEVLVTSWDQLLLSTSTLSDAGAAETLQLESVILSCLSTYYATICATDETIQQAFYFGTLFQQKCGYSELVSLWKIAIISDRSNEDCQDLMNRISSFVLFSPASASQNGSAEWLTERILKFISHSQFVLKIT
ncbi:hypothetical protein EDD21DRAFT_415301 [Dissophora ornata]|nr:hypothetical protein EDD21DRAFT_415301 [Dissophora ornata]